MHDITIIWYNPHAFINMKEEQRNEARELRTRGFSIREICESVHVSRSTASLWVRDIELTKVQIKRLKSLVKDPDVIERRRQTRLASENVRRNKVIHSAFGQITNVSRKELTLIGAALYWAEGKKGQQNTVSFSNSDPRMIKIMMHFFRDVCAVPEEKFRGYVHIHPHLDYQKAEKYWSEISNIPLTQFYKTYRKKNKSSQNKRDTLPYGTFDIYVCNAVLFLTIRGWFEGIAAKVMGA